MLRVVLLAWLDALKATWRDKGAMPLLILAPLLYGYFYPWPYAHEVVQRVPVAVVDLDASGLSRQIARFAAASPRLDVRLVTGDEGEAQQAMWRGELQGYAVLPRELKRQVLRGQSDGGEGAVVTIYGNGAYPLLNKAVQYGFAEAVGTVSAGVEIRKRQARGESAAQAAASRALIGTQMVARYNPTEGYGSYVVPAVAVLIIQQTLLMGIALLVGTFVEAGVHKASLAAWSGRLLAFCSIGLASALFYFFWVFSAQDYPRLGNPAGALLLLALYLPAVALLGSLLGVIFADRERALQVLLFTSLPMAFLSGFSWPAEALPAPLAALRWLIPSTAGIQASLRLNQMGADVADVAPELLNLLGLCIAFALLLWWRLAATPRQRPN